RSDESASVHVTRTKTIVARASPMVAPWLVEAMRVHEGLLLVRWAIRERARVDRGRRPWAPKAPYALRWSRLGRWGPNPEGGLPVHQAIGSKPSCYQA